MPLQSWAQILQSSAMYQFAEGVGLAWDRVLSQPSFVPDEGLILSILAVAGRWGRSDMAVQALEMLARNSIQANEHHLNPLLEAYVNAGNIPAALKALSSMRSIGFELHANTLKPLVRRLNTPELIDSAFFTLEDMYKAGELVDIAALNALIEASVNIRDLPRVRSTQMAAPSLGLTPNIDTFNIVLLGCVTMSHRELGDTILSEMADAGIAPSRTTYERIITLALQPPNYEDAFYYLERMKADGHKPGYNIYRALIRKCALANDRRWTMVREELESLGYKLDDLLQRDLRDPSRIRSGPGEVESRPDADVESLAPREHVGELLPVQ